MADYTTVDMTVRSLLADILRTDVPPAGAVGWGFVDDNGALISVPLGDLGVVGGQQPAPAYTAGDNIDITGNVISALVPELLDPLSYQVMAGTAGGYIGYATLEAAAAAAPNRPIAVNVPRLNIGQDVTLTGSLYAASLVQILLADGVTVTLSTGMRLHNIQFLRVSGSTAKVAIASTLGSGVVPDATQAVQLVDSRIGPDLVFSAVGHAITARGRSAIDNATGNPGTIYLYDVATAAVSAGGPTVVNCRPGATSGAGTDSILPVTATRTAAYTLALADAGCLVPLSSASAVTVTVPDHATVPFPIGTTLYVAQDGAGDVTIAGASGVVVQTADGYKVGGRWLDVSLHKRDLNTWVLKGGVQ